MRSISHRRFRAYLFDFTLFLGAIAGYSLYWDDSRIEDRYPISFAAFFVLLLLMVVYYILTEFLWQRSLGKLLFGIKVVKIDGSPLTFKDVCKRHLFTMVEVLCLPFVAGVLVMQTDSRSRLGDLFAKTRVVKVLPPTLPR